MTASQSVTNRKRLDKRVADLEKVCADTFLAIAWDRDCDRHDFVRLIEIIDGLARVERLVGRKQYRKIDLKGAEWDLEWCNEFWSRPWWRRVWLRWRGEGPEGAR